MSVIHGLPGFDGKYKHIYSIFYMLVYREYAFV